MRKKSDEELSQIRDDMSVFPGNISHPKPRRTTVTTASYFGMYRNDSGAGHAFFQTSRSTFCAGSKSCLTSGHLILF